LDKASSYYSGETVFFATKHGKEELIAPLFRKLAMSCVQVDIDTDQFGTFAGEVERKDSALETLRKKIKAAAAITPHGRLFLASEGSFGPDPFLPFFQADLESLLLWDRELKGEIYAEHLCRSPRHAEMIISADDDTEEFLARVDLPNHAVIVRPEGLFSPIFKGLHHRDEITRAVRACAPHSTTGKVMIATDLRANHNKTRRDAILKAADALNTQLCSQCPACTVPGFGISRGIPGLPCESCGEPSTASIAVLWECRPCNYTEERPRPDGRMTIGVEECPLCNP